MGWHLVQGALQPSEQQCSCVCMCASNSDETLKAALDLASSSPCSHSLPVAVSLPSCLSTASIPAQMLTHRCRLPGKVINDSSCGPPAFPASLALLSPLLLSVPPSPPSHKKTVTMQSMRGEERKMGPFWSGCYGSGTGPGPFICSN